MSLEVGFGPGGIAVEDSISWVVWKGRKHAVLRSDELHTFLSSVGFWCGRIVEVVAGEDVGVGGGGTIACARCLRKLKSRGYAKDAQDLGRLLAMAGSRFNDHQYRRVHVNVIRNAEYLLCDCEKCAPVNVTERKRLQEAVALAEAGGGDLFHCSTCNVYAGTPQDLLSHLAGASSHGKVGEG